MRSPGLARLLSSKKPSLTGVDGPEALKGKAGPFSSDEVHLMEDWAWSMAKASPLPHVRPTLEHFLRTRLGEQFRPRWRDLTSQRLINAKKTAELDAKRPPPSTHFAVSHAHPEGEGQGGKWVVVSLAGFQHKVCTGDVLAVAKLPGAPVGQQLRLGQVLMLGDRQRTLIGRPLVPGVEVVCAVEQQTKEAKQLAFHKRRRKASKKVVGSRREVTVLRVLDIVTSPPAVSAV